VDWMVFEWINRIGAVLRLLIGLGVASIAVVVALSLTKKRICREAAWLLALGLVASWTVSLLHSIIDVLIMPMMGWGVTRWISYGLDVVDLLCFAVIGAGLYMFRVPRGGRR